MNAKNGFVEFLKRKKKKKPHRSRWSPCISPRYQSSDTLGGADLALVTRDLQVDEALLVAGDFNAHNPDWDAVLEDERGPR